MNLFTPKTALPDAKSPRYVAEVPDGPALARHAASFSTTFPDTPPDGCYRCEQELYISFFFDGFAHDQKLDAAKGTLSNVGRLFAAHRDDPHEGVYRRYFEGLGTRLSDEPVTAAVIAHNALSPLGEKALGLVNAKAKQITTDPYKKPISKAAKTLWDEPLDTPVKVLAQDAAKAAEASVEEQLKGATVWEKLTDWKGLIKGNWAGLPFDIIAASYPPIRDSEVSAALLGTGVEKRVEKAIENFKDIVTKAKEDPREIKKIRIAVFGYDRGALVARKFATEFMETICKPVKGEPQYEGLPIECDFMGLFDSVSASYADALFAKLATTAIAVAPTGIARPVVRILAEGGGQLFSLVKRTLGAVDVPDEFKRVVHYVAANELRFYKRADSLRKSASPDRIVEVVFPGTQPDVGGGRPDGEHGKSNALAKLAARSMHQEAWSYGVPLLRLDELASISQVAQGEFRSAELIPVDGAPYTVDELFQSYLRHTQATGPLENHFMAHQKVFLSYLRHTYDRTRGTGGKNFALRPAFELQGLVANSGGSFSPRLGVVIEQPDVSAKDIADPNACELGMTWERPISLSPLVTAFFDHIFHNTMTEPLNDAALDNVSYFMLRPVEDLPKPTAALPDPIPGAVFFERYHYVPLHRKRAA